MPTSPIVNFKVENNNVLVTTPQTGISCLVARTTKGPYNDPSNLLTTFAQFKNLFGEEIVPDGTPSNIEKAFMGGSKLRIIRVPGAGYFKGVLLNSATPSANPPSTQQVPPAIMSLSHNGKSVTIGFYTKTYDEQIDGSDTFDAKFVLQGNTVFCTITGTGKTDVLEQMPVITFKNNSSVNRTTVDYLQFYQFLTTSKFLEPVIKSVTGIASPSIANIAKWLADEVDNTTLNLSVQIGGSAVSSTAVVRVSEPGSSGTAPTASQWISSLEYLRDYSDFYHVGCSHIDQHLNLSSDQLEVHAAAKQLADELEEWGYMIEVPKYTTHYTSGTTVRDKASIITWIQTCIGSIGNSRNVWYFAGGIKYYDNNGILVDSDILGTIMGLADNSGSKFGPWLSFAGINRGCIYDGNGPSTINFGAPARYNDLNDLAGMFANVIVVKDTFNAGKQTMLWHNFTSQIKQDSFKFISIIQLIYYLKKMLRPILESKIEEPNYIPTWMDIYLLVKPELDYLVEQNAMSEYTWSGDQNATGYADLQVNNEADVRQGKYKAVLTFKDIVPMQEITMSLVIDKTTKTSTIEVTE